MIGTLPRDPHEGAGCRTTWRDTGRSDERNTHMSVCVPDHPVRSEANGADAARVQERCSGMAMLEGGLRRGRCKFGWAAGVLEMLGFTT